MLKIWCRKFHRNNGRM